MYYSCVWQDCIQLSSKVLGVLLKIVTLIGCTVVVFGYANSFLALHIYGGQSLSTGSGKYSPLFFYVRGLNAWALPSLSYFMLSHSTIFTEISLMKLEDSAMYHSFKAILYKMSWVVEIVNTSCAMHFLCHTCQ